jgi:hypothetical protein
MGVIKTSEQASLEGIFVSLEQYLLKNQGGHPITDPGFWAQEFYLDHDQIDSLKVSKKDLSDFERTSFKRISGKVGNPLHRETMRCFLKKLQALPQENPIPLTHSKVHRPTVSEILSGLEYRFNNDVSLDNLPSAYKLATFRLRPRKQAV